MANYVAILSPCPATIKELVATKNEPGLTPLERREKIKLTHWQKKIFEETTDEKQQQKLQ